MGEAALWVHIAAAAAAALVPPSRPPGPPPSGWCAVDFPQLSVCLKVPLPVPLLLLHCIILFVAPRSLLAPLSVHGCGSVSSFTPINLFNLVGCVSPRLLFPSMAKMPRARGGPDRGWGFPGMRGLVPSPPLVAAQRAVCFPTWLTLEGFQIRGATKLHYCQMGTGHRAFLTTIDSCSCAAEERQA